MATTNSVDGGVAAAAAGLHAAAYHAVSRSGSDRLRTRDQLTSGPFYCPVDQTAYFDTDFFQVLVDQFGSSGGPLAQEYVVAHEYGHHVQNLQGVLGRAQQDPEGATGRGCAHRAAGRLLRRSLGALRGHHQTGEHRCAVPGAVERQGHCRRAVGRLVGGRRPHPEAGDRAGSTPSSGPTGRLQSGRSGSPSATRPATPTSATPSRPTTLVRPPTAVDAVAERYLDTFAVAGPMRGNGNGHHRPR